MFFLVFLLCMAVSSVEASDLKGRFITSECYSDIFNTESIILNVDQICLFQSSPNSGGHFKKGLVYLMGEDNDFEGEDNVSEEKGHGDLVKCVFPRDSLGSSSSLLAVSVTQLQGTDGVFPFYDGYLLNETLETLSVKLNGDSEGVSLDGFICVHVMNPLLESTNLIAEYLGLKTFVNVKFIESVSVGGDYTEISVVSRGQSDNEGHAVTAKLYVKESLEEVFSLLS